MKLDIQALCHVGMVRENNEDALSVGGLFIRDDATALTVTTPQDGWFYLLVSDGMGGHERGEEASEYTLTCIREAFESGRIGPETFEDDIRKVVSDASATLNRRAFEMGQTHPMGCTLTGVVWHYGHVYLVNAGDSRTYRFREGILRQLSTDETERGITGDPTASKYLLNCIGGGCEGRLNIDSLDGKLLEGDSILICSDGLTDMVPEEKIEAALEGGSNATDLLRMACDAGGADNISIILAYCL
ncbi:MAG: serine/threonine-protein phosphatase [Bacteroidales bacterium]|nr:serine/threonine-protein phosphatase [Bacteroidales bacterium]